MRTKLMRAPLKYVQGRGALGEFAKESADLGSRFLFVCSRSGADSCREALEAGFAETDVYRRYEIFGGVSSVGEIERMRAIIRQESIEVVVGLGGGSAIDTAKAAAHYEDRSVAVIPTVCATDAPCTGLSVIYNDDHSFRQYLFYPRDPALVLVDTLVIAAAPVRYLVSGMGDALGTYFEARVCAHTDGPSLEGGGVTRSAMALCRLCYDTLLEHGAEAKRSCEHGLDTPALDAVIEANTYLSGVGADNGGLAVAHSVYNGLTVVPGLKAMHGECVAFGTLTQLILEGAPKAELREVLGFCREVGLPVTLAQLGIPDRRMLLPAAEAACAPGESVHNMPGDVSAAELFDALCAADALGRGIEE